MTRWLRQLLCVAVLLIVSSPQVSAAPGYDDNLDGNFYFEAWAEIQNPSGTYTAPSLVPFSNSVNQKIRLANLSSSSANYSHRWITEISFWGGSYGLTPYAVDTKTSIGYPSTVTWAAAAWDVEWIDADADLSGSFNFTSSEWEELTAFAIVEEYSSAGNKYATATDSHGFTIQ